MHCSQTITRWMAWAGGQGRHHALLVSKEAWTNLCGKLLPGPLGNGVHPGATASFTCSNWESKLQARDPYGKRMGPYQRRELRDSILLTHKRFGKCDSVMSCLTLCDSMDCSPSGSSVHGIFQARILEWVAISFSKGSSWQRDWTQVFCSAGRFFTVWATREARKGWKP